MEILDATSKELEESFNMKNYFFKNKNYGHSYTVLSEQMSDAINSLHEHLRQYYGEYFSSDKTFAIVSIVVSDNLVTASITVNEEHFTTLLFTLKEYDVGEIIDTYSE